MTYVQILQKHESINQAKLYIGLYIDFMEDDVPLFWVYLVCNKFKETLTKCV